MNGDFLERIAALSRDPFLITIITLIVLIIIVLLATRPKPAVKEQKKLTCVLCGWQGCYSSLESPKAKVAREKHGGYVCHPCRDEKLAKFVQFRRRK